MHATRTKGKDKTSEQQREEFMQEYEKRNGHTRGRDDGEVCPPAYLKSFDDYVPPVPIKAKLPIQHKELQEAVTSSRFALLQVLRAQKQGTLAELTHAAFRLYPHLFGAAGLDGELIPCTHKVKDCLYSKSGLLKRGLVYTTDRKVYKLTRETTPCAS